MHENVKNEITRMIDQYFHVEDLNQFLKTCVTEKENERSIWSDLTLYTHYMLGGQSESIYRLAAISELILLALDMADDLQDRDNADKPWMRAPEALTLNSILSFITASFAEINEVYASQDHAAPLSGRIFRALAMSINGQQRDLYGSVTSEADYIAMVQEKSGSLIELALHMGYCCIETFDIHISNALREMAYCLGIKAQLGNDVRDILRFDIKNDLLQKKKTLPTLFLLSQSKESFPPLKQFYEGKLSWDQFITYKKACLKFIEDSGCIEYAQVIQSIYLNKADEIFNTIPTASPWREKFQELMLAPLDFHASIPS